MIIFTLFSNKDVCYMFSSKLLQDICRKTNLFTVGALTFFLFVDSFLITEFRTIKK